MKSAIYKSLNIILSIALCMGLGTPKLQAEVVVPIMPKAGTMVSLSPAFTPAHLKGIVIHPENALQFDFLINHGQGNLNNDEKNQEYTKLVKYFLAALTTPDQDQWVNLSPYEKDRIVADNFGKTEMGRDLLAQDYLLKQITSSLMYPESGLGKNFWDKVYANAKEQFGNTQIPVNTFNKVWILPDQATVVESGNTAYIERSHLKVMLEEDYLATKTNTKNSTVQTRFIASQTTNRTTQEIIRQVILPELEREVNEGKNFAQLRQVFSAMILATWYKKTLKESLLGKVYADKAKVKGVDQADVQANEQIYQQYLQAFKKGAYNYIKEERDQNTQQTIPRKYFAGGVTRGVNDVDIKTISTEAMASTVRSSDLDAAMISLSLEGSILPLIPSLTQQQASALNTIEKQGDLLGVDAPIPTEIVLKAVSNANTTGIHHASVDVGARLTLSLEGKTVFTVDELTPMQSAVLETAAILGTKFKVVFEGDGSISFVPFGVDLAMTTIKVANLSPKLRSQIESKIRNGQLVQIQFNPKTGKYEIKLFPMVPSKTLFVSGDLGPLSTNLKEFDASRLERLAREKTRLKFLSFNGGQINLQRVGEDLKNTVIKTEIHIRLYRGSAKLTDEQKRIFETWGRLQPTVYFKNKGDSFEMLLTKPIPKDAAMSNSRDGLDRLVQVSTEAVTYSINPNTSAEHDVLPLDRTFHLRPNDFKPTKKFALKELFYIRDVSRISITVGIKDVRYERPLKFDLSNHPLSEKQVQKILEFKAQGIQASLKKVNDGFMMIFEDAADNAMSGSLQVLKESDGNNDAKLYFDVEKYKRYTQVMWEMDLKGFLSQERFSQARQLISFARKVGVTDRIIQILEGKFNAARMKQIEELLRDGYIKKAHNILKYSKRDDSPEVAQRLRAHYRNTMKKIEEDRRNKAMLTVEPVWTFDNNRSVPVRLVLPVIEQIVDNLSNGRARTGDLNENVLLWRWRSFDDVNTKEIFDGIVNEKEIAALINSTKGIIKGMSGKVHTESVVEAKLRNSLIKALNDLKASINQARTMNDSTADAAMSSTGGIDMNASNMDMLIKRDGRGVVLPLSQQDLSALENIEGFVPRIIEIRPAVSLAVFQTPVAK